ncbi:hypothetical protein FHT32_003318 [Variovorax sp. SG517]|uniref:IS3 family transposase n=1 Tax=Variovorax sp. SG517 TaxID=2587117 RepID=UPI00159D5186|nr:IS3 family transposase [Variovorax sp. SG517]NVM89661.1 hypothetical protein [Variovorax sp. SG517]
MAEARLDIRALNTAFGGKALAPQVKHAAVATMSGECGLRERRARRLVRLSRDSYRNPPETDAMTQEFNSKIVEIAHARRRFGYRRIHDMLRSHFPSVNHKRVFRLYSTANLAVRKRKEGQRPCQRARAAATGHDGQ